MGEETLGDSTKGRRGATLGGRTCSRKAERHAHSRMKFTLLQYQIHIDAPYQPTKQVLTSRQTCFKRNARPRGPLQIQKRVFQSSLSLIPDHLHNVATCLYGLGICRVLLTIRHPWSTNMNTTGWNSRTVPSNHKPNGICASVQPL